MYNPRSPVAARVPSLVSEAVRAGRGVWGARRQYLWMSGVVGIASRSSISWCPKTWNMARWRAWSTCLFVKTLPQCLASLR